jgi:hypothetical protein
MVKENKTFASVAVDKGGAAFCQNHSYFIKIIGDYN